MGLPYFSEVNHFSFIKVAESQGAKSNSVNLISFNQINHHYSMFFGNLGSTWKKLQKHLLLSVSIGDLVLLQIWMPYCTACPSARICIHSWAKVMVSQPNTTRFGGGGSLTLRTKFISFSIFCHEKLALYIGEGKERVLQYRGLWWQRKA